MQKWAEHLRSGRTWTRAQALDVLQRHRDSGVGVTAFAKRMGFVPQRLFWWKSRLRDAELPVSCAQTFVPVVLRQEPAVSDARLGVELGDGVVVHVHPVDAATAGWVALLAAARSRS